MDWNFRLKRLGRTIAGLQYNAVQFIAELGVDGSFNHNFRKIDYAPFFSWISLKSSFFKNSSVHSDASVSAAAITARIRQHATTRISKAKNSLSPKSYQITARKLWKLKDKQRGLNLISISDLAVYSSLTYCIFRVSFSTEATALWVRRSRRRWQLRVWIGRGRRRGASWSCG